MSNEELLDEVNLIVDTFPDECRHVEEEPYAFLLRLPYHFELQVTLPPHSYPAESYPQLFVTQAPNSQLNSAFSTAMHKRMREALPLGIPMCLMLVALAQQVVEEIQEQKAFDVAELQEQQEAEWETLEHELHELQRKEVSVWSSAPITDRKSKFVAHLAPVECLADVREVMRHLRSIKSIAIAAHPTIWAYRFTDADGVLHQDCEDDGESGASVKMAFLLEQMQVDGYVVVVTRWFGGILLGPDRFKHISNVTRNILLTIPDIEAELKKGKGGGKR
ncbi:hypothetical protein STCU_01033 [Strigomonas culicis]|nr:hypothetical protein STCU_03840 [Strigomonas culicis]EPY35641.1 hypothetical protein STCU_01033 [Strigomonas culicis]|eukprot:EPY30863.1 hypothetical protein STCU_03840 [Strigomonas culicis]